MRPPLASLLRHSVILSRRSVALRLGVRCAATVSRLMTGFLRVSFVKDSPPSQPTCPAMRSIGISVRQFPSRVCARYCTWPKERRGAERGRDCLRFGALDRFDHRGRSGARSAYLAPAAPGAKTARGLAEEILVDAHRQAETIEGGRSRSEARGPPPPRGRRRRGRGGRATLREQEKRLEKRADLLDQKLEHINRKEREVESIQRFLRRAAGRTQARTPR